MRAYLPSFLFCCVISPAIFAGDSVEKYLAALEVTFDTRVIESLERIEGTGSRLLAARAYIRSEAQLDERWSWNEAQIAAYEGSPEQQRLNAAIARVRCVFESRNPGHTLYVNETVRSLDEQIAKWNGSDTVRRSAGHMLEAIRAGLATPGFPAANSPAGVSAFRKLLVSHKPVPTPTLAAPGLSRHGRMEAVDFQVHSGNRVVAGPEVSSVAAVWESGGWKTKLQAAVTEARVGFVGPLQNPNEPWHYEFRPDPDMESAPLVSTCAQAAN